MNPIFIFVCRVWSFGGLFLLTLACCCTNVEIYGAGEMTTEQVAVPKGERSILFAGDTMTWDRTREHLEKEGANYPFLATAALLQSADIAVANLEGPVAARAKQGKGKYVYKVPPWTLTGVKWAGFDLVSLANNHVRDCGVQGVEETLENLSKTGIKVFGAGRNEREAARAEIVGLNGTQVAFLGFVAPETYFHEREDSLKEGAHGRMEKLMERRLGAGRNRPGTIVAKKDNIEGGIRGVGDAADLVVVFIHFGIRYHRPPTEMQRYLAHIAIDAGADIVVGHHAHFWQPVEIYRGKPIVYGLGNFAFGSGNRRADEALLARVIIRGKRFVRLELFPLYIKNKDRLVAYQPKVMKGDSAREMLGRLTKQSRPFGVTLRELNGRAVLSLGPNEL